MENTEIVSTVVIPLLLAIVPATISSVISFLIARSQSNKALETEIQKLKVLQQNELEKIKAQNDVEIQKLIAQQEIDNQKAAFEIERMKLQMDKQAELYEKNAQTDITKELFGQLASGNSVFENMASGFEKMDKFQQDLDKLQSKMNARTKSSHPATRSK